MNDRQLKNYKKYTLILLLVTVAACIVCAAAFSIKQAALAAGRAPADAEPAPEGVVTEHYTPKQAASQETPAPGAATASPAPTGPPESYVVSIRDGKIGVFPAGGGEPVLLSGVQAYLLPEGDVELLRQGIPARTLAEARAILEDYE